MTPRAASLNHLVMPRERPDEAVESAPVGESPGEPTDIPQVLIAVKPPYQIVGVREVQEEGREIGPPHRLDGIAVPAVVAVRLQVGDDLARVYLLEGRGKIGVGVLKWGRGCSTVSVRHRSLNLRWWSHSSRGWGDTHRDSRVLGTLLFYHITVRGYRGTVDCPT